MPALYARASADLPKALLHWNFLGFMILWINSWCYYYPQKSYRLSALRDWCFAACAVFWAPCGNKRPEDEQRQLPVIAYKGSKKKVILSNSTRKKWDLERFPLKNLELTKILSIFATWKEKPSRATMCGTVAWLWKHRDDEQFDLAAWFLSLRYWAGHVWPAFIISDT